MIQKILGYVLFYWWYFLVIFSCSTSWQIDCFDYDDDGTHDFIGGTNATLRQLLETKQTGVRSVTGVMISVFPFSLTGGSTQNFCRPSPIFEHLVLILKQLDLHCKSVVTRGFKVAEHQVYYNFILLGERNEYHVTMRSIKFQLRIFYRNALWSFAKIYQRNFEISWNFCKKVCIIYAWT